MMMNCIIVDDEQYARKLLEGYVDKIPQLELKASCKNSFEAMTALQNHSIQLMFLDIQMPDLTGIEFLKTLNEKPMVIFTTAYKEFALEGYELNVVDYMLKPISFERFTSAYIKAAELHKLKNNHSETKETDTGLQYVNLKANHKIFKVAVDDILYVEGLKEYVTYYTQDQKYVVLESLKNIEEKLPEYFMRIHKSYIINTRKIQSLYGNQIEISGKYIPIGKVYSDNVKNSLFGL